MLGKIKILIAGTLMMFAFQNVALAQTTILPKASGDGDCAELIDFFNQTVQEGKKVDGSGVSDVLGCAITTGRISLGMVPYFIRYFSNYLLGLISLIALLFVVIGGFMYIAGGLTEQKDRGKTYIKNALIGMVTAFLAWTVVNVILAAITG